MTLNGKGRGGSRELAAPTGSSSDAHVTKTGAVELVFLRPVVKNARRL